MRMLRWALILMILAAISACGTDSTTVGDQDLSDPALDLLTEDDQVDEQDMILESCSDLDKDGFFAGPKCREGQVQDCNNEDATIYPGAAEVCSDGIDQDCSGADKECPGPCEDADKDGYFAGLGCRDGLVQDCDDANATVHPGAEEVCGDGKDQDCNDKDKECPDPCVDNDADGHFGKTGTCASGDDCDDANRFAYPGANEICEDGVDQNCDGKDDACPEECSDGDGDGYGDGPDCKGPDCNDANGNVHPGAAEICGNGMDEDCSNGDSTCPATCVDEDLDGVGVGGACPIQDCNDDDNTISPLISEVCGDGVDQDCDGVDTPCSACTDPDGDGYGVGTCLGTDCNETDPNAHQGAAEICGDGIDQDCNGTDLVCAGNCTDADEDGYGSGTGCLGTDCNDGNAAINPGATDACGNGVDEDCAGGDKACPPATCVDDWDCGTQQLCDLAAKSCKGDPKVWEWWAPTLYVDTEASHPGWNLPVAVNFDGNWNAANNAVNIDTGSKKAVVYYSFVKTSTHWYLGYYFYFPRRWSSWPMGTQYDNALTGVLLVVEQDGTTLGKLVLMETFTEDTFYQYTPEDVVLTGPAGIDGTVRWDLSYPEDHHPIVYVHTEDHGVWGDAYTWNNVGNWEDDGFPGGDGIVYRYGNLSEAPQGLVDEVSYTLLENKGELWSRRNDIGASSLFDEFGHFAVGLTNSYRSVAPWRIYDANTPTAPEGEVLYDPADLVRRHFTGGWGPFSYRYVYNPYAVMVELVDLMVKATADAFGGAADPFVSLFVCDGGGYLIAALNNSGGFQKNWLKWDVEPYTLLEMSVELGGRNFFYGLSHPDCSAFGIEVRDYDDVSGNDWLMDDEQTAYYDFSGEELLDWGKSDATIIVTPAP